MLDTLENIETPEGVSLSVRPAGIYARSLARLIDTLVQGCVFAAVYFLLNLLGELFIGLALIVLFVTKWLYDVLFEVLMGGATPGKRVLGLHVVYTNGAPVGANGSVVRNFLRIVDWLPALYVFGVVLSLFNARFQRLGDIAAGTVVAYQDDAKLSAAGLIVDAASPMRLAFSRDEHRAIANFGARVDSLSAERQVELAELLTPLSALEGREAVQALQRHAGWLSGH
ncbi:MAG: RDD family protein [Pseudomonadota bacterium]